MDGEPNLPPPSNSNLSRPINLHPSSRPPEPDFLRNVQAAFKRHRSIGTMQSTNLLPRRSVPPQRETSKSSGLYSGSKVDTNSCVQVASEVKEDASLSPPSFSGASTNTYDDKYNPFGAHVKEHQPANCNVVDMNVSSCVESKHCQWQRVLRRSSFLWPALLFHRHCVPQATFVSYSRADGHMATRMDLATRLDNLSSHMDSLALTEMEWEALIKQSLQISLAREETTESCLH
ncbi:V-type ATP synthase alpha chain [Bienertia sinuspersici]